MPDVGRAEGSAALQLCEALCTERQQAQATAAEPIADRCHTECIAQAGPAAAPVAVPQACREYAAAARREIESVPMQRRAAKVWTALSQPELHCGYRDPFLDGLGAAKAADLAARDAALDAALRVDPYLAILCPTDPDVLDLVARDGLDVFASAARCGIDTAQIENYAQRDLSAQEFLAYSAVHLRWEAQGLLQSPTHAILLDILLLSSGLERENAR